MECLQVTGSGQDRDLGAPLFRRLGGAPALRLFTVALVSRAHADALLGPFFAGTNPISLIEKLERFLCALTGGPGSWRGPSLSEAHAHLAITLEHFERMMALVRQIASEMDLPETLATELAACLSALELHIVNSASRPTLSSEPS